MISGKSGSGKDTLANIMRDQLESHGLKTITLHYADLVKYYLNKLSDPYYERELEQAENQRLFICENMASWITYDEHAEKILQKIKEFAAA